MYNCIIYRISAKLKVHLSYGILFDILFIIINAIPFKLVRKVYQLSEGNFIKMHQTMLIRYFFVHIFRFQLCIQFGINLSPIISAILYHNL